MLYSGELTDAEKALRYGLLYKIVDEDKLLDAGIELAQNLLSKSPLGLRMTKEAINLSMDSPSLRTMIHLENISQDTAGMIKDAMVGATAFLQKKRPKYPLR